MSYQFTISDIGLRLIKAYEGYAPDGRILRGGRKIVGYGRVSKDPDLHVTLEEAEDLLATDLEAIQDIVNTNVHAAMSQSQFDALCSLAFSIGPKAFLSSDVLHAFNRGEVIGAANGFDGWRLGNIDGQIYMVDALVRRRTAEKALFLRPTHRIVPAPHEVLRAKQDEAETSESIVDAHITTTSDQASQSNVVTLYETAADETDIIELTDRVIDDEPAKTVGETVGETADNIADNTGQEEAAEYTSPIAEAAAEVSGRLDALMNDQTEADMSDWPESLVDNGEQDALEAQLMDTDHDIDHDIDQPHVDHDEMITTDIADITETDGSVGGLYDSAEKYIEPGSSAPQQSLWTYVTMIILGLTAAGGGLWANMKSSVMFGDLSPLVWSASVAMGVLLLFMGLYYLTKNLIGKL